MPAIVKFGAVGKTAATVLWQSIKPTVTASSAVSTNPAINVTDPDTWSSWRGAGTGACWLMFDFAVAITADGFGISAHTLNSGPTRYLVQYSLDGVAWVDVHEETPTSGDDIFCVFRPQDARYWRLYLPDGPANIGVFVIGKRLIFPHAPVTSYKPLHHSRMYKKEFTDSIGGNFLGTRTLSVGAETDVNMGFFERDWLERYIGPFESHYNQGGTFFYSGSPVRYPLDVGYCRAKDESGMLEIEWIEADKLATLQFGIRSYVG